MQYQQQVLPSVSRSHVLFYSYALLLRSSRSHIKRGTRKQTHTFLAQTRRLKVSSTGSRSCTTTTNIGYKRTCCVAFLAAGLRACRSVGRTFGGGAASARRGCKRIVGCGGANTGDHQCIGIYVCTETTQTIFAQLQPKYPSQNIV